MEEHPRKNPIGAKDSHGCLNYAYHNGSAMEVWVTTSINNGEWVLKRRLNLDDIEFHEPSEDLISLQRSH